MISSRLLAIHLLVVLSTIAPTECITELSEGRFLRGAGTEEAPMHEMQEEVEERVEDVEHDLVTDLAERMKPRDIDMGTSNNQSQQLDSQSPQSPPTHQFFHLHHMKSGGTSLSSWIRCGQSRLGGHLASAALSECGATSYHRCIDNETDGCRKRIDDAVTMNFCSPLAVTNYFKWADADAVTMMRHPGEFFYIVCWTLNVICCTLNVENCIVAYCILKTALLY